MTIDHVSSCLNNTATDEEHGARRGDTYPVPDGGSAPPLALRLTNGRIINVARQICIGSAPDNDLVLDDSFVSGWHCIVQRTGGRVIIKDCGSRNGTLVGGLRVSSAEIRPGVLITVGQTTMRVIATNATVDDTLIGRSAAVAQLRAKILRVAPTRASVLLVGESGTGKELAARGVHAASGRKGEFIAINCGAMAAELVESELFGHERGAFTGAQNRRPGVFLEAQGGTLFLDEIGDLPLHLQPKLLRVLETSQIRAVGGQGETTIDVRIIAATHIDLRKAVDEGKFRLDLYHRLAVVELALPSLREHREDIPALAQHFVEQMTDQVGAKVLSAAALEALVAHSWSGNVRELRNAVQRGAIFADQTIEPGDLFPHEPTTEQPYVITKKSGTKLEDLERHMIEEALKEHSGNRRAAALALGMPKSTLCDKVRRYGLID